MQWPPSEAALRANLPQQEHSLFEFKSQWYDFEAKRGKAEFVKDVLAMGNTTTPDAPGYIVVGFEDPKHGGAVVGVKYTPESERLQQILLSYASPAPDLQCAHLPYGDVTVSVLRVGWTPSQPYYAIRDHEGILVSDVVYTRRGGTIGRLRPPEIEALIRQKEARIRTASSENILDIGFVENGRWNRKVVARVVNLTDDVITDLTVVWDVRLPAIPGAFTRFRSYNGGQLGVGETREDEFEPEDHYFVTPDDRVNIRSGVQAGTRWFDITLHVQFRDRDGFLRQVDRYLSTGG
jgi:hypothetical protein